MQQQQPQMAAVGMDSEAGIKNWTAQYIFS